MPADSGGLRFTTLGGCRRCSLQMIRRCLLRGLLVDQQDIALSQGAGVPHERSLASTTGAFREEDFHVCRVLVSRGLDG